MITSLKEIQPSFIQWNIRKGSHSLFLIRKLPELVFGNIGFIVGLFNPVCIYFLNFAPR